jgi:transcriptional regulator with XRE-family HTH domain
VAISDLTIDTEALYTALDRKRRAQRMSRRQVTDVLGVSPPSFTQWGAGQGMSADVIGRACAWLETDLRAFLKPRPVLAAGNGEDVSVNRELTEQRDEAQAV